MGISQVKINSKENIIEKENPPHIYNHLLISKINCYILNEDIPKAKIHLHN